MDDNAVETIYYNFTKMNMSCVLSSCKCGQIIRASLSPERQRKGTFPSLFFSPSLSQVLRLAGKKKNPIIVSFLIELWKLSQSPLVV